ncbi:MAG TPA: ABC transporter permease [Longimicrobium sp.]|nr:ABC transporter permease [Longimicrobium sp.]
MSEVFTIVRREFVERVRGKSFLVSTLLLPLLMGGMFTLLSRMGRSGGERHIVIVDQAPAGVGTAVQQLLSTRAPRGADDDANVYTVERVAQPLAQVRAGLIRRVQDKQIDGWLYLPPTVVQNGEAQYRARNVADLGVVGDLTRAVTRGVQSARLQTSGISPAQVAALVQPARLSTAAITKKGEEGGNAQQTFWLGYIVGLLTYMMILLYGMNVLRSVLEEKTNKIAEVIVSSMKASHLMLGKILGVGSVALLQVGLWAAFSVATSRSGTLAARFHLPSGAMKSANIPPVTLAVTLAFFILGFFLYSAVYAALGAAVNSEQEAQQFQVLVVLPLVLPVFFLMKIVGDPLGRVATVLGLIPFTAPVTMAMRLATAPVPPAQIAASLAGLVVTVLAVAWIAGKIYRVGILSTGKKPSLAELGQWLRAA